MAKNNQKFEHLKYETLEKITSKKFTARDKKTTKPKMTISGKKIFELQKLIVKKGK